MRSVQVNPRFLFHVSHFASRLGPIQNANEFVLSWGEGIYFFYSGDPGEFQKGGSNLKVQLKPANADEWATAYELYGYCKYHGIEVEISGERDLIGEGGAERLEGALASFKKPSMSEQLAADIERQRRELDDGTK